MCNFHHVSSINEEPRHGVCPPGKAIVLPYQRRFVQGAPRLNVRIQREHGCVTINVSKQTQRKINEYFGILISKEPAGELVALENEHKTEVKVFNERCGFQPINKVCWSFKSQVYLQPCTAVSDYNFICQKASLDPHYNGHWF